MQKNYSSYAVEKNTARDTLHTEELVLRSTFKRFIMAQRMKTRQRWEKKKDRERARARAALATILRFTFPHWKVSRGYACINRRQCEVSPFSGHTEPGRFEIECQA